MITQQDKLFVFLHAYTKQHEACPKCGSIDCRTTLLGHVVDSDDLVEYKDLNRCECAECGDVHTTHDRIPKTN